MSLEFFAGRYFAVGNVTAPVRNAMKKWDFTYSPLLLIPLSSLHMHSHDVLMSVFVVPFAARRF